MNPFSPENRLMPSSNGTASSPPQAILLVSCLGILFILATGCTPSDYRRGEQLGKEGKWDEAVTAYRKAAKAEPFDDDIAEQLQEAKAQAGAVHYTRGTEALEQDLLDLAVEEFKWAVGYDPARSEHQAALADGFRLQKAQEHLTRAEKYLALHRLDDAMVAYERAVEFNPSLTKAVEGITTVARRQQAAKSFVPSTQPVTLRFQKAKLREVFEVLARTAGVNVVFDKDVRDDPVTIFLKDMPYDDALNVILSTNNVVAHRLGHDTLLITPNTKQKQAQYQDLMIRTFYLSNTPAKNIVNLLRSMLESKRVYVDEQVNAVVVRDSPAKLHLAERVIHAVDLRQPEVVLDLEVLEVNRTKSLEFGMNFAKMAGAGSFPQGTQGPVSSVPSTFTYQQLANIGTGSYLFTIPSSILLDFFKQESDAKTLAAPKLRVLNKESASISVGDKQPILLSTTNVLPGQVATGAVPTTSTVTSVEFKDTGVKLTVEPTVHLEDELTLKIKVEITRLGDEVTLQASPEITQFRFGTRNAETKLRLRNDETVILAGLIQDEHRKTRVTLPWLGDIPWIGDLFSSTTTETIATEVVVAITPHIIWNLDTPDVSGQAFWSGTASRFATDRLFTPTFAAYEPLDATPEALGEAPVSEETESPLGEPAAPSPGLVEEEQVPSSETVPQPELTAPEEISKEPSIPTDVPLEDPVASSESENEPPSPSSPSPDIPSVSTPSASSPALAQEPSTGPIPPVQRPSAQPSVGSAAPPASTLPGVSTPSRAITTARLTGMLHIQPSHLSTTVGQDIRVDLHAQGLEGLTESVVTVNFNPTLLEFVRSSEGALLQQGQGSTGTMVAAQPGTGQVILHIRRHGTSRPGTGSLVALFFRTLQPGTSPLTIRPTLVQGVGGHRLQVSVQPGMVVVQ